MHSILGGYTSLTTTYVMRVGARVREAWTLDRPTTTRAAAAREAAAKGGLRSRGDTRPAGTRFYCSLSSSSSSLSGSSISSSILFSISNLSPQIVLFIFLRLLFSTLHWTIGDRAGTGAPSFCSHLVDTIG
jgi:hypothetical protein